MRIYRAAITCAVALGAPAGLLLLNSCGGSAGGSDGEVSTPHVEGRSKEAIGKYLIMTGGCNDCHTPGAMEGNLPPESQWLTGSPLGFNGPWGTTYAPNLRLKVMPYNEEMFVKAMKMRNTKPPMPWEALHAMTDADLGSVFVYIKSLGPAGQAMPEPLPPGKEPAGPYIVMAPPTIGKGQPGNGAAASEPRAR